MCCFVSLYDDHRDIHVLTYSVPTRLSPDLVDADHDVRRGVEQRPIAPDGFAEPPVLHHEPGYVDARGHDPGSLPLDRGERSEEHPSELQSLMRSSYAVVCLTKTIQPDQPRELGRTPVGQTINNEDSL